MDMFAVLCFLERSGYLGFLSLSIGTYIPFPFSSLALSPRMEEIWNCCRSGRRGGEVDELRIETALIFCAMADGRIWEEEVVGKWVWVGEFEWVETGKLRERVSIGGFPRVGFWKLEIWNLIFWLNDWMTDWLIDWLTDWLNKQITFPNGKSIEDLCTQLDDAE